LPSWLPRSRTGRSRRSAATLAGVLVCVSGIAAWTAPVTIDAGELSARLQRAGALASAGTTSPSPERMQAVRDALALPVDVRVGGNVVGIARDDFLEHLRGDRPDDFTAASDHIDALTEAFQRETGATVPPRSAVEPALAGAYAGVHARPGLLALIRERLSELLRSAFDGLARLTAGTVGTIVAVIVGLAILLLVGLFVARRTGIVQERAVRDAARPVLIADPQRALAEALSRGDLDAAVHAHYALLLAALAARGVVPDQVSLTAGECRAAVASTMGGMYSLVERATGAFERVAYGDAAARQEDVQALQRATDAVRAA
jgi:uncharacterized protein DUF4129